MANCAFYCSQGKGCICYKCLFYWSGRCDRKCNQQGCKGGFFNQAYECDRFIEYDRANTVVKDCLEAVVQIYQDGYMHCSLVDNVGCEECYKRFNEKQERREIVMIKFINVKQITPHPNNPRKDLGDLSELANSIKATGILQNLTVVNGLAEGTYTVIIGHRRLAAAKLAGLAEVPCIISDMDINTQIATMLLENMQRNDLTILEQADGIQMMIDLGETVSTVSEKTGFSVNTVRRRVKLLELDRKKFMDSVARGATLQDFAKLDDIKDIELKNKVLATIGTPNFGWELKNAIGQEANAVNKVTIIAELEKFATRVENSNGMRYTAYIGFDSPKINRPDDAGTAKYFFTVSQTCAQLYKENIQATQSNDIAEKQKELQGRREQLAVLSKTAFNLRFEFVKNYTAPKKLAKDIMEIATRSFMNDGNNGFDMDLYIKLMGVELGEGEEFTFDIVSEAVSQAPEKSLLWAAYCNYGDSANEIYYRYYDCNHEDNEDLNAIYDTLVRLGYQMSDEEKMLRYGTHELFTNQ